MKRILYIVLFAIACNGEPASTHEVRYSSDGKDSVVHVTYYDGKQFNGFYLQYFDFSKQFEEGGYETVYDYYLAHQLPEYWIKKYSVYKRRN